MALKLKVTLVRSAISRPEVQRRTVKALGLTKLNKSRVLPDNLAVRGMIRSVSHLVQVEVVE
ncbi:MAG: 50S ribosomal protein L30 [Polyangia bacterium]|jgi:large subunit ribosomal protein L30